MSHSADLLNVLVEFVTDIEAAYGTDMDEITYTLSVVEGWPDLAETYRKARALIE